MLAGAGYARPRSKDMKGGDGMKLRIIALLALVLLAALGCAETRPGSPTRESIQQTTMPTAKGAQLMLFNVGWVPGTYCRCGVDTDTIPNRIKTDEYVEYPVPGGPGKHRVECSVETLNVPVSFTCDHAFETFGAEKVYLSISGTGIPGTCNIQRLSLPPAGFSGKYKRVGAPY